MSKGKIDAPSVVTKAEGKMLNKMYIANVMNRLVALENPNDIDRKRWVWELIQNAKDTIAKDSTRKSIKIRIEIDGDTVKFQHNGSPFTADSRQGLLYKYSEDKEDSESTGRYGTGFLTTHCLSKTVSIESNMYKDEDMKSLCGFRVTMYRSGLIKDDLLKGLDKMRESEEFYEETFPWTTFTYYVSTDSGRRAVELGIDNFKKNIAQTMLFCKQIDSIELNNNGEITTIERKPIKKKTANIKCAEFEIHSDTDYSRRFLFTSYCEDSEELSVRYKTDRKIRIDAAIEVDKNNNIVSHTGDTSFFCVLPLVGIENQLDEPLIINSPDFEPDSERQSLLLSGEDWDENEEVITAVGINRLIYEKISSMYECLVEYLSEKQYGNLHLLANGLKKAKKHNNLDKEWYEETVIESYRDILLKYPVVKPYEGSYYKLLEDCIIIKEDKEENEETLFDLLTYIYPEKLAEDNHNWAQCLWKKDLQVWKTEDVCNDISEYENWDNISLTDTTLSNWYNDFLAHVRSYDASLLDEYALLPNMNGDLLQKDEEDFKQGKDISSVVIDLLDSLGKDVKPMLLHSDITAVSLGEKYNSQSFSADVNKLAKEIIEDSDDEDETLEQLLPLLSILPTDEEKYSDDFLQRRKYTFDIAKEFCSLDEATPIKNNNLLEGTWKSFDIWFTTFVLEKLHSLRELSALPNDLDAAWINNTLISLGVDAKKLNKYQVLPNQDGTFCKQKDLYIDAGIPKELKDDVFDEVEMYYKSILLHEDIDASAFSISKEKTIDDFAVELNGQIKAVKNSSLGNYFYGSYHRFPQQSIESVSLYVLSLLPKDKKSNMYARQSVLLSAARDILAESDIRESSHIDYDSRDLWKEADLVAVYAMVEKIEESNDLDELNNELNECGENHLFKLLNPLYDFVQEETKDITARIYPNQNGVFCEKDELFKEEGSINETLKEITTRLLPEGEGYRDILMDKRCSVQPLQTKNAEDIYKLIDDKVSKCYNVPDKWQDEDFIQATKLLIDDWGNKHKGTFEENFPKTYPIRDSIAMNVIWKKEEREVMSQLRDKYSLEELNDLIENGKVSSQHLTFQDLTGKEVDIPIDCGQYSGLSEGDISSYLQEAKDAVVKYYKELNERDNLGMCFDEERIKSDSYSQLYGIYDKDGNELPLVVHSYRGPEHRNFALNGFDWDMLSKLGAQLWVNTVGGLQCVPLYALPIKEFSVSIDENLPTETKAALLALAFAAKQFTNVSFGFGNNMPSGFKKHLPFSYLPKQVNDCTKAIKDICQENTPDLKTQLNCAKSIPLRSGSDYSEVIDERRGTDIVKDLTDAPKNSLQPPEVCSDTDALL